MDKGRCCAGPRTYRQRTGWACEFGGIRGDSGLDMVEFRIWRERDKANRITTLSFMRRANFGLFVDLLGYCSWVVSSTTKSGPSRWAGNEVQVTGGLHGRTRSS